MIFARSSGIVFAEKLLVEEDSPEWRSAEGLFVQHLLQLLTSDGAVLNQQLPNQRPLAVALDGFAKVSARHVP